VDPACEDWLHLHAAGAGVPELVSDEAWATVWRVPTDDGPVWCKQCAAVQAFEPKLTHALWERWPDRVPTVLAHDAPQRRLLLADAGTSLRALGDPVERWLTALPRYAELQRGETAHVDAHIAVGVPDRRVATLPARYDELLRSELPIPSDDIERLRDFAPRFADWCDALERAGIPPSVQHDDLHGTNVFVDDGKGDGHDRVIDWGDASIGHPFASMVVTFRFLEPHVTTAVLDRLRDAYLEPWGRAWRDVFDLALRVGAFARAVAYLSQRVAVPDAERAGFDEDFTIVLQRALRGARL
jgi:phosphotransferase family enzyme